MDFTKYALSAHAVPAQYKVISERPYTTFMLVDGLDKQNQGLANHYFISMPSTWHCQRDKALVARA